MFTKKSLKRNFQKDWKKHYHLQIFKEKGFSRKSCLKCGKFFWTLDPEKKLCGGPPCQNYEFIGKPVTKKKWDYIEMWKEFEIFFKKHGHESIKRYPVVDRWRPDLYFTIASIQDFQRIDQGNMVFEYPADPLIVPQVCLRFNDIQNVGITGRHLTSFVMGGQHSFGNYWKDRCIELNFNFLHKNMGIPAEELIYIEDVWAMPDFSQFGPSLETFSLGLELSNSVFSQFTKTGNTYKPLPKKVIDVGWGHERLVWFSQGTSTGYESAFGPVIEWVKKQAGFHKSDLFDRYAVTSGSLTIDEVKDIAKMRENIAKRLGIDVKQLNSVVEPIQALYAITDHVKTLLFAVTDGGIPSNVGGGYNLRVLLRRVFSFMKEYDFDFSLEKVAEMHASYLKPIFPELSDGLQSFSKILDAEKERYENTMKKAGVLIQKELNKNALSEETMITLYTSNGITPELVEKVAAQSGRTIKIPEDFYEKITSQHMKGEKSESEKIDANLSGIKETGLLFYDNLYGKEFDAKVVRVIKDWAILDKTMFYPEGGGQPYDIGFLDGKRVLEVKKVGGVILHKIDGKLKPKGNIHGVIDWNNRYQLMKMHTATHIVSGSARKILGSHIWQAGAQKGLDISRIDLTHYKPFTNEELEKIENLANEIVRKNLIVHKEFLPRNEAEKKYGFVLYQGGASPGKEIRVIRIQENGNIFDVEACGGTHINKTGEIETIKIVKAERVQDGVNRIEFTCGKAAHEFTNKEKIMFRNVIDSVNKFIKPEWLLVSADADPKTVSIQLESSAKTFSVSADNLQKTIERFYNETLNFQEELNKLRSSLNIPAKNLEEEIEEHLKGKVVRNLKEACEIVFDIWKKTGKEAERLTNELAQNKSDLLMKKSRDNKIFEIIHGSRKELIEIANKIISKDPDLTIILVNEDGEIIGMSKTKDMDLIIRDICERSGGSGGGRKDFAQGRVVISKLIKTLGSFEF
jgi:alanyl-tRNA synthetase